jgi:hypothetical protein
MYTDVGDTRLYLRCKVVKTDGSDLAATEDVTVSNMFLHSLIQRLDVYVGDTLITQSGGFYPWKAAIETLLNFGTDAKNSHLAGIIYYKDTPGDANLGHTQRKAITTGSKSFELFGPLHVDYFFQDKYLLNNVPMRIKITRNPADFYLMSSSAEACKVVITEAVLYVRRIQVAPSVELAHSKTLLGGKSAVYPIHRGEIEVMSVPPNQQTISRDNLFMSRLPKKLIMGMVENDAFNGKKSESPFNFKHFGLKQIEVQVDGENVCGTPMQLDFSAQKYMRAYDGMFHALNKSYTDSGLDISYTDFKNGYALFCFDLTADGCGNTSNHFELAKQGNLRFKMTFEKPLTKTINVVLYGEFESILEINNAREVLLDYKN